MTRTTLTAGTRGSKLALIQTQIVTDAIRAVAPALEIETRIITTEGDRNQRDSLTKLGGRGVFVGEIEQELRAGAIDFAVHSLKDLPASQPDGLLLVAVLPRGDARDALVSRNNVGLQQLPQGARVGSSSERRSAQLRALRSGLDHRNIRGNVDTRIRKLDNSEYDAIVLAAAGLERLGLRHRITSYFSPDEMLPSVGQGALVIECRADDKAAIDLLRPLDHAETRAAVEAERAFLRTFGAGCSLPVGGYATLSGDILRVEGLIANPEGTRIIRDHASGPARDAEALGRTLGEKVLQSGGRELLKAAKPRG